MIVFDTSTVVGAVIRRGSIPDRAVRHAFAIDNVAVSDDTIAELVDVLYRPRLARFVDPELRDDVLWLFDTEGVNFQPSERITSCRDPKDNIYLELAATAGAAAIVSGDADLLDCIPGVACASCVRPITWRRSAVPPEHTDRRCARLRPCPVLRLVSDRPARLCRRSTRTAPVLSSRVASPVGPFVIALGGSGHA